MLNTLQDIVVSSAKFIVASLLFTYPLISSSSEPVLLNQNINGNVERFELSTQSEYVIYNEFDNIGRLNRFSIKASGNSNAVQVASDLSEQEADFWIQDNIFRVLSRNLDSDGVDTSILSITEDASSPPSLLSTFTPSSTELENIGNLTISSDDPMIIFSTRAGGVYTIPIDGSSFATNLSPNLDPGFSVDRIRATRDRQNVIFSVDRVTSDSQLVFIVPTDGSSEPTLLTELPPFADMDNRRITSLDDSRLIYISETVINDGINERQHELQLFSLALDGNSEPIALSEPIISGPSIANPSQSAIDMSFQLSTDGSRVAYLTNNEETNLSQLFITTIDGSASPILLDSATEIFSFQLSTPQEQIFYSRRQEVDGNIDIAAANINGDPNPISISNAQISANNPAFNNSVNIDVDFALSEDGLNVFFITQDSTGTHLFKSPPDGSCMRIQLSSNPLNITSSTVNDFQIINNDQTAIYSADLNTIGTNQLFSVSTNTEECITPNSTSTSELNNSTELSSLDVGNIIEFDTTSSENNIVFTSQTSDQLNQGLLSNLYSLNIADDEPLCFPIKTQNDNFVTICL